MVFEQKPNSAFCFKKDGFEGYSGAIKLDNGQEFWITVYDNTGNKGPYRSVKLKPKQPKAEVKRIDPQAPSTDFDGDFPTF